MKINILPSHAAAILCMTILVWTGAAFAQADKKVEPDEKTCSGTVTAVDAKEKAIKVQRFLFNKTFVLTENCALSLSNQKKASLDDFRLGQKVNINYIDAGGMLVADRIAQEELHFSGRVQAMDCDARILTIRHWGASKTFTVADGCNVKGGWDHVRVGDQVKVIFEAPDNHLMARQIEQRSIISAKWDRFPTD